MTTPRFTTDPSEMDVRWICENLSKTYWAKGRSLEDTASCVRHSLNFAFLFGSRQIAYARVVTDYTVFAYIMDVFVDEDFRRMGHASSLMQQVMSHEKLKKVKVWRLATTDQQRLYNKFGFSALTEPGNMMELKIP